jgi:hypothetical protein
MREYEQFLKLLALYAVTAKVNSGARVLDASDFQEWVIECVEKARTARDAEEFFSLL